MGVLTPSLALVQVSIVAVNDGPVAQAVSVEGSEDVPLAVLLVGSDVEGSSLSYQVVQAPQKGVLSGEGAQRTYTPELNYHGTDSFTYTVFDGELLSAAVSVTLTLQPVNDAPVAITKTYEAIVDNPLDLLLAAIDVEGDALSFSLLSAPNHGVLTGEPPEMRYTPDEGYVGLDTFEFQVSDGDQVSTTAVATSFVAETPNGLKALQAAYLLQEDDQIPLTLSASSDIDEPFFFQLITQPTHGRVLGDPPDLVYVPKADFYGDDALAFRVVQSGITSQKAVIQLTVEPVNDACPRPCLQNG